MQETAIRKGGCEVRSTIGDDRLKAYPLLKNELEGLVWMYASSGATISFGITLCFLSGVAAVPVIIMGIAMLAYARSCLRSIYARTVFHGDQP